MEPRMNTNRKGLSPDWQRRVRREDLRYEISEYMYRGLLPCRVGLERMTVERSGGKKILGRKIGEKRFKRSDLRDWNFGSHGGTRIGTDDGMDRASGGEGLLTGWVFFGIGSSWCVWGECWGGG